MQSNVLSEKPAANFAGEQPLTQYARTVNPKLMKLRTSEAQSLRKSPRRHLGQAPSSRYSLGLAGKEDQEMEFLSSEYAYLKHQVENRLYQYQDDVDKQTYVYSTEPARSSNAAVMRPRVCDVGLMTKRLKAQL